MARKRTLSAGRAVGNEQALIVEELTRLSSVDLKRDPALDGVLLEDADLSGIEAASVRLVEVALRRVNLGGTGLRGLHLLDVLATAVDAANGSWPYTQMSRVTFESSTLVGLDLANGQIGATTFSECKLDLANLRLSTVQDVVFLGCSLRGADFYGANLRSVRFEKCDLCEIDFGHATLEMVDLRTSTLTDIRGIGSLKGATVDGSQLIDLALSLAVELGIQVENLGEDD
ncbi:MAG: pentapeptide repeat-containing protein [Solirubrobacteraceae bacterium]